MKASLRQCNDELRQRLSDMKKQMAKQSTQTDHANVSFIQIIRGLILYVLKLRLVFGRKPAV
jgi:hypothetical protein